jgi:ParB family chromosome partitioning protein
MATKKTGLGRGLNALISQGTPASTGTARAKAKSAPAPRPGKPAAEEPAASDSPREVPVHLIVANPWQPREHFDEEGLEELTASVREMGVLSPLLVRKRKEDGSGYQLIAGERRFRAAQRAGLKTVPVLVRELTDQEALEIALVENLQRRDLNIIEEAEGYQRLAEDFGLTQEAIAKRVGKGRATVANAMRLLSLDPRVRTLVSENRLSAGHAKVLLALEIEEEQALLAAQCERERWSVRELERQVKNRLSTPKSPKSSSKAKLDIPADHLQYLTDRLHQRLGTSVRISPTRTLPNGKKQRGKVEIDFYSNDDLDRVLDLLGLTGDL